LRLKTERIRYLYFLGFIISALLGAGVANWCQDPIGRGWFSEWELFSYFLLPSIVGAIAGAICWKLLWKHGTKRGWRFSVAEFLVLLTLIGIGLALVGTCR
jgi:hypothetical protein